MYGYSKPYVVLVLLLVGLQTAHCYLGTTINGTIVLLPASGTVKIESNLLYGPTADKDLLQEVTARQALSRRKEHQKLFSLDGLRFDTMTFKSDQPSEIRMENINGQIYLFVANDKSLTSGLDVESTIYTWSNVTNSFTEVQSLPVATTREIEYFVINNVPYIITATNNDNNDNTKFPRLYYLNGNTFVQNQTFAYDANFQALADWGFCDTGDTAPFLAASPYSKPTKLYQWNPAQRQFAVSTTLNVGNSATVSSSCLRYGGKTFWALSTLTSITVYLWDGSSWNSIDSFTYSSGSKGNHVRLVNLDNEMYALASATDAASLWRYSNATQKFSKVQDFGVRALKSYVFNIDDRSYLLWTPGAMVSDMYRWNSRVKEFDMISSVTNDLGIGSLFKGWGSTKLPDGRTLLVGAFSRTASMIYQLP